jgi:hypothetical protein
MKRPTWALFGFCAGLVAAAAVLNPAPIAAVPQMESGRQVIAEGVGSRADRCDVPGFANDEAVTFEIDTGDPDNADFPSSYISRLGIKGPLYYKELWPGTRYGKIARTTLRQIQIGDVVWHDLEINVYTNWDYSFGSDETPLLGLKALKSKGLHIEIDGGTCRLTVEPPSPPFVGATQDELHRLGGNLNQLMRHANATIELAPEDVREVAAAMRAIITATDRLIEHELRRR